MAEFIVNPRRTPRAPARCRAAVTSSAGAFDAETEDIGARGCQVISPRHLAAGEAIELVIACDKVADPLKARGKVCWVSEQPPWRVGVAFDEPFVPSAERWFEKLVGSQPRLGYRRVPEKIPVEAMVYLGPPPKFLVDFTAEEASLLRFIASGARIDELQARLRDRWPAAQRALFSLLARQAVTLSRGHSAHPDAWKRILTEVEASLAIESLGTGPQLSAHQRESDLEPTPAMEPLAMPLPPPTVPSSNPAASPWGAPARDPHPSLDLGQAGPALDLAPRGAARAQPGVSWGEARPPARPTQPPLSHEQRTAEAQALYERAKAEMQAGSVNGAIALLRKALSLSPGNPDIAAALGKLAFKDRVPGTR